MTLKSVQKSTRPRWSYLVVMVCLLASHLLDQTVVAKDHVGSLRQEICLDGDWDFQIDGGKDLAKIRVPGSYTGLRKVGGKGYIDIWDYPEAWQGKGGTYTRTFELPPGMKGRRVFFRCGGVRYSCTVKVNDKEVGSYQGSEASFEMDITTALREGVNTFQIHIDPIQLDSEDVNSNRRGIWGDVFLRSTGDLRITDETFVMTSVAGKNITCRTAVRNDGLAARDFRIRAEILDGEGKRVGSFSGKTETIPPASSAVIPVSSAWEDPRLWSPVDPYLYRLRITLDDTSGKPLDEQVIRFGFREITWKGPRLYLNGKELHISGTGDHTEGDIESSPGYLRLWMRKLRQEGLGFMRLHTMVKSAYVFDIADEEGMLLEAEAPHHFKLPSPERAALNVERLVTAYRNHPSVLAWSVSNELHWKGVPEPGYLIDLCHRLDPTRPAFASDFSGWSVLGDVIGHHYNTLQVFDEWAKFGPDKPMIWDEFGWIWPMDRMVTSGPSGYEYSSQDRSGAALWHDAAEEIRSGIEFFQDGKDFAGSVHRLAVWSPWDYSQNFHRYQPFGNFQTQALDDSGADGKPGFHPRYLKPGASFVNVWDPTLPEWEPNPGYDVLAPYLRPVRYTDSEPTESSFFGGTELVRHSAVAYDDLRSCDTLACLVETPEGRQLSETTVPASFSPGGPKSELVLRWRLPEVLEPTPVKLVRECRLGDKPGDRVSADAVLYPKLKPSLVPSLRGKKLAVTDPGLARWLGNAGFSLSDPTTAQVLIGSTKDPLDEQFVRRGGRVLRIGAGEQGGMVAGQTLPSSILLSAKEIPEGPVAAVTPSASGSDFSWYVTGGDTNLPVLVERSGSTQHNSTQSFPSCFVMGPGNWEGRSLIAEMLRNGKPAFLSGSEKLEMTEIADLSRDKKFSGVISPAQAKLLLRPVVRTSAEEWYVASLADSLEVAESPVKGSPIIPLEKNLRSLTWHRLPVGPSSPRGESSEKPVVPDFSSVTSFGFLLDGKIPQGMNARLFEVRLNGDPPPSARIPLNGAPHRLLSGLGQEQFTFWRGGSSSAVLPVPSSGGNVRIVLQGDKDGIGAALAEYPSGKGVRLESSLRLSQSLNEEPAAHWMLRNILEYLSSYETSTREDGTGIAAGIRWKGFLEGVGLAARPLSAQGDWNLKGLGRVILDIGSPEVESACRRNASALGKFVRGGGTALVFAADPKSIETLRAVTGRNLRLTDPFLGVRDACIKAPVSWTRRSTPPVKLEVYDGIMTHQAFEACYDPLLSGLANRDLFWEGAPMFSQGIEIEGMDPVMASPDHSILISNWKVPLDKPFDSLFREYIHAVHDMRQNSWFVNRDPVLLRVNDGKGSWILCQLDLPSGGERGKRIASQILTNLRCSLGSPTFFEEEERTFDPTLAGDQLRRFSLMAGKVPPARRRYYGTPDPLPDYLRNTFSDPSRSVGAGSVPSVLMLGDDLLVSAIPSVSEKMGVHHRIDGIGRPLGDSRKSLADLDGILAGHRWDSILFCSGQEDLRLVDGRPAVSPEEFEENLGKILVRLKKSSDKVYWASIVPPPEGGVSGAARAAAYNAAAERVCRKLDVYFINFGEILEQAAPGYSKRHDRTLTPAEIRETGNRLASALQFLG